MEFLHTLAERYKMKDQKVGTYMARKSRKVGTPSNCLPSCNAPQWTRAVNNLVLT